MAKIKNNFQIKKYFQKKTAAIQKENTTADKQSLYIN
tara:strand:- start:2306 stop:2416 length:111 start_codon:yes stop_codon:yes gene_type:complete